MLLIVAGAFAAGSSFLVADALPTELQNVDSTSTASPEGAAQMEDRSAIRAVIETYFRGHATADASHFREAFLPTAHIEGNRGGKFVSWTLDAYCAGYKGVPAADEASRKRWIDNIEVTGDAAMAKATLVHGAVTFADYFVLLKVDGVWKIANKVYSAKR
jgi:hypothetical protein